MILLRLISWPYARKHVLRTILTTAGIVLGVGVFVGMHTANQSVLYALHETVDRIAGATELQVTAGETGFDEEVLERVQARPEVRVAVPVIEAVVDTGLPGQGSLLILAVDMTGDRSLRDYDLESGDEAVVDDPLVFLAQPDSLIVTREFAARNGLADEQRRPDAARWRGRSGSSCAGIMQSARPGQRLRRQPRHHGRLRGAEGVRPRPEVRPDRPRGQRGRDDRPVPGRARSRCSARASRWRRPAAAGSSSSRCCGSTR